MSRMPPSDWKEWATKRPVWMGQDAAFAFEEFIERKWLDALNIAATEPTQWRGEGEKGTKGPRMPEKTSGDGQGTMRLTGAVNVVEQGGGVRPVSPQWDLSFRRRCRARNLIGCDGDHVMLQCDKLLSLGLAERKDVLGRSGLCTFCLKHSTELECYGKGGLSQPRCTRSGCDGEHTPYVHMLMGEDNARVNLIAGDEGGEEYEFVYEAEDEHEVECEYEDGGLWVGTVGAVEVLKWGEEAPCSDGASVLVGRPDGVVGDDQARQGSEFQVNEDPEEDSAESGWWDLELGCPGLEDGEVRASQAKPPHHLPYEAPRPGHPGATGQQGTRERPKATADRQWEEVRQNARFRQMLSNSPSSEDEDEDEERHGRFAESGRWMPELYGLP
jgi:hypothetical protein